MTVQAFCENIKLNLDHYHKQLRHEVLDCLEKYIETLEDSCEKYDQIEVLPGEKVKINLNIGSVILTKFDGSYQSCICLNYIPIFDDDTVNFTIYEKTGFYDIVRGLMSNAINYDVYKKTSLTSDRYKQFVEKIREIKGVCNE